MKSMFRCRQISSFVFRIEFVVVLTFILMFSLSSNTVASPPPSEYSSFPTQVTSPIPYNLVVPSLVPLITVFYYPSTNMTISNPITQNTIIHNIDFLGNLSSVVNSTSSASSSSSFSILLDDKYHLLNASTRTNYENLAVHRIMIGSIAKGVTVVLYNVTTLEISLAASAVIKGTLIIKKCTFAQFLFRSSDWLEDGGQIIITENNIIDVFELNNRIPIDTSSSLPSPRQQLDATELITVVETSYLASFQKYSKILIQFGVDMVSSATSTAKNRLEISKNIFGPVVGMGSVLYSASSNVTGLFGPIFFQGPSGPVNLHQIIIEDNTFEFDVVQRGISLSSTILENVDLISFSRNQVFGGNVTTYGVLICSPNITNLGSILIEDNVFVQRSIGDVNNTRKEFIIMGNTFASIGSCPSSTSTAKTVWNGITGVISISRNNVTLNGVSALTVIGDVDIATNIGEIRMEDNIVKYRTVNNPAVPSSVKITYHDVNEGVSFRVSGGWTNVGSILLRRNNITGIFCGKAIYIDILDSVDSVDPALLFFNNVASIRLDSNYVSWTDVAVTCETNFPVYGRFPRIDGIDTISLSNNVVALGLGTPITGLSGQHRWGLNDVRGTYVIENNVLAQIKCLEVVANDFIIDPNNTTYSYCEGINLRGEPFSNFRDPHAPHIRNNTVNVHGNKSQSNSGVTIYFPASFEWSAPNITVTDNVITYIYGTPSIINSAVSGLLFFCDTSKPLFLHTIIFQRNAIRLLDPGDCPASGCLGIMMTYSRLQRVINTISILDNDVLVDVRSLTPALIKKPHLMYCAAIDFGLVSSSGIKTDLSDIFHPKIVTTKTAYMANVNQILISGNRITGFSYIFFHAIAVTNSGFADVTNFIVKNNSVNLTRGITAREVGNVVAGKSADGVDSNVVSWKGLAATMLLGIGSLFSLHPFFGFLYINDKAFAPIEISLEIVIRDGAWIIIRDTLLIEDNEVYVNGETVSIIDFVSANVTFMKSFINNNNNNNEQLSGGLIISNNKIRRCERENEDWEYLRRKSKADLSSTLVSEPLKVDPPYTCVLFGVSGATPDQINATIINHHRISGSSTFGILAYIVSDIIHLVPSSFRKINLNVINCSGEYTCFTPKLLELESSIVSSPSSSSSSNGDDSVALSQRASWSCSIIFSEKGCQEDETTIRVASSHLSLTEGYYPGETPTSPSSSILSYFTPSPPRFLRVVPFSIFSVKPTLILIENEIIVKVSTEAALQSLVSQKSISLFALLQVEKFMNVTLINVTLKIFGVPSTTSPSSSVLSSSSFSFHQNLLLIFAASSSSNNQKPTFFVSIEDWKIFANHHDNGSSTTNLPIEIINLANTALFRMIPISVADSSAQLLLSSLSQIPSYFASGSFTCSQLNSVNVPPSNEVLTTSSFEDFEKYSSRDSKNKIFAITECPRTRSKSITYSESVIPLCTLALQLIITPDSTIMNTKSSTATSMLLIPLIRGTIQTLRWSLVMGSKFDTPAPVSSGKRIVPQNNNNNYNDQQQLAEWNLEYYTNFKQISDRPNSKKRGLVTEIRYYSPSFENDILLPVENKLFKFGSDASNEILLNDVDDAVDVILYLPEDAKTQYQNLQLITNFISSSSSTFGASLSRRLISFSIYFPPELDENANEKLYFLFSKQNMLSCRTQSASSSSSKLSSWFMTSVNLGPRYDILSPSTAAAANIAASLSGVFAMPVDGSLIATTVTQTNAILDIFICTTSKTDAPLSFLESPLGLAIGGSVNGGRGKYLRGAVVGNIIVLLIIGCLILGMAFVIHRNKMKMIEVELQLQKKKLERTSQTATRAKTSTHAASAIISPQRNNQNNKRRNATENNNNNRVHSFFDSLGMSSFPSTIFIPLCALTQGTISSCVGLFSFVAESFNGNSKTELVQQILLNSTASFASASSTSSSSTVGTNAAIAVLGLTFYLGSACFVAYVVFWRMAPSSDVSNYLKFKKTTFDERSRFPDLDIQFAKMLVGMFCNTATKKEPGNNDNHNGVNFSRSPSLEKSIIICRECQKELMKEENHQFQERKARSKKTNKKKNQGDENDNNNTNTTRELISRPNFLLQISGWVLSNLFFVSGLWFIDDSVILMMNKQFQQQRENLHHVIGFGKKFGDNSKMNSNETRTCDAFFISRYGRFFSKNHNQASWYPLFALVIGMLIGIVSGAQKYGNSVSCSQIYMLIIAFVMAISITVLVIFRPSLRSTANTYALITSSIAFVMCVFGLLGNFDGNSNSALTKFSLSTVVVLVASVKFVSTIAMLIDLMFLITLIISPKVKAFKFVIAHFRNTSMMHVTKKIDNIVSSSALSKNNFDELELGLINRKRKYQHCDDDDDHHHHHHEVPKLSDILSGDHFERNDKKTRRITHNCWEVDPEDERIRNDTKKAVKNKMLDDGLL